MHRAVLAMRVALLFCLVVVAAEPTMAAATGERWVVQVVRDGVTGTPRYEPGVLFIEPGETVLFKNAGNVHASRIIPGMMPDAADPWWGQLGEDVEITFTEPGVYGHKCGSSYPLGLVGLVVVGDPSVNLEAARAVQHPPAAAREFERLFDELAAHLEK